MVRSSGFVALTLTTAAVAAAVVVAGDVTAGTASTLSSSTTTTTATTTTRSTFNSMDSLFRTVLPTLVSRPAADVSSSSSSSTTTASGSDNVTFDARTTQQVHDSSNNNSNNNNDNSNNWQQQQQTKKQTNFIPLKDPFAPTPEEREAERLARRERARERQAKVAEAMKKVRPPPEQMQRVSDEELEVLQRDHPEFRELWGSGSSKSKNLIQYADPGQDYDMWSQAYRMLGGFIDCDHQKSQGSGDHNEEGGGNNNAGNNQACSRWMMWAAYVDPNYQGYGYNEYFGDDPVGVLDCHRPDTDWVLMGVYRQEFYQYIEQISKHLWAIDQYEYVVALAGLAYMTDDDCFYVGADGNGNSIYAGVAPQPYGGFQMALYTDTYCLTPNDSLGKTFDDFGLQSGINLGSKDATDDDTYSWAYDWWYDTQEYTLTQLNEVYEQYMYCTSCIDYPTYQDGYVIGNDGMDDDDLINQCWKFYSHDSYPCESDCIALGHSQGTILSVVVGNKMYGEPLQGFYTDMEVESASGAFTKESKITRLLANTFVTFSFIVFVATFLAFAVARRSRYRESRGSKSRRLLDDDDRKSRRSRKHSTSRRKSRGEEEGGDGIFRSSASRKSRSKSTKRRSSSSKPRDGDERDKARSRSRKRSDSRVRSDEM